MRDKREEIMVRLVELGNILKDADLVKAVFRNQDEINDRNYPACLIMDADEEVDMEVPGSRPASGPTFVVMTPEVYFLLGAVPEEVGTKLNEMRRHWLYAVLNDTVLQDIVGTNGRIRYVGCATGLSRGRAVAGDIGVSIDFRYVLKPADLGS